MNLEVINPVPEIKESNLNIEQITEDKNKYHPADDKIITQKTKWFEIERLENGKDQFNFLKCILCFRISTENKYFPCCDQIVCAFCAEEWLNQKKICPNCRKQNPAIQKINNFIVRMFEDLRLNCSYTECNKKDIKLNEVDEHEQYCSKNPQGKALCENCTSTINKDDLKYHNCLKYLTSKAEYLEKKSESLVEINKQLIEKDYVIKKSKLIQDYIISVT